MAFYVRAFTPREIRRCSTCGGEAEVLRGSVLWHWSPQGKRCHANAVEGPLLRIELIHVDFGDRWAVIQAFARRQTPSARRLPNGFYMHRTRITERGLYWESCTAHGPTLCHRSAQIQIDEVGGPGSAKQAREATWCIYTSEVDEVRRLLGYAS